MPNASAPAPLDSSVAAEAAVRAAAARARIAVPSDQVAGHAAWLRAEVEALDAAFRGVRVGPDSGAVGVGAGGMPLREDAGPAQAMTRDATRLAPSARLGLVLVPRLAGEPTSPDRRGAPAGLPNVVAGDAFAAELEAGA